MARNEKTKNDGTKNFDAFIEWSLSVSFKEILKNGIINS